jgi:hypothetical protein
MTDDRLKNFIGAALGLEDRARDALKMLEASEPHRFNASGTDYSATAATVISHPRAGESATCGKSRGLINPNKGIEP